MKIINNTKNLLRQSSTIIFIIFVVIAGFLDSIIWLFSFWHLEELALVTGHMESIKLIEGCVTAAQCCGSSVVIFFYSEKILNKFGYKNCASFCFFMYAILFWLIAVMSNPWFLVVLQLFLQGITFSLMSVCIVSYAADISPPGTIATVQGFVLGTYDSIGLYNISVYGDIK